MHLYLFAVREHANERRLQEIEAALEPPNRMDRQRGLPMGWQSEDDDIESFAGAPRV